MMPVFCQHRNVIVFSELSTGCRAGNSPRMRESSVTFTKGLFVKCEDVTDTKASNGNRLLIAMIHFCMLCQIISGN